MKWYTPQTHRFLVDWLTVFGAIGAAIAASFAACYTYQQWQAAEKTLQATVRPYIKVDLDPKTFEIRKPPQAGGNAICIDFVIVNTGKLPAYLTITAAVYWYPITGGKTHNWPRTGRGYRNQLYLFEKQNIDPILVCSRELTEGEIADFKNSKNRDVIVGIRVSYGIMPADTPFITKVCTQFRLQDGPLFHLLDFGGPCGGDGPGDEPNNFSK